MPKGVPVPLGIHREGRGAPAIWFGSNEVQTRSANFPGGGTLNGTECSNQGPRRTLNGMEHSVWGVQGLNLGSELNFSITSCKQWLKS